MTNKNPVFAEFYQRLAEYLWKRTPECHGSVPAPENIRGEAGFVLDMLLPHLKDVKTGDEALTKLLDLAYSDPNVSRRFSREVVEQLVADFREDEPALWHNVVESLNLSN